MPVPEGVWTLAEVEADRAGKPLLKGKSRSQLKAERDKVDENAEEHWKREVRTRDEYHCRWCRRRVVVTIELVPERAECHHLVSRTVVAVRWDVRNGILLCLACHERVTGVANEKFLIVASATYVVEDIEYPDMRQPVEFKRIA